MQGAEQIIDLPDPAQRPRGLFVQVAEPLTIPDARRLGLGVVHVPLPCTDSYAGPLECETVADIIIPGNTGTPNKADGIRNLPTYPVDQSSDPDELPYVTHPAFKVVDGLSCSNLSLPTRSGDSRSLPDMLRALVMRNLSGMYTAELVTAEASGGLPLSAYAVDIGSVDISSAPHAIGWGIDSYLAEVLHGDRGVVLVPVGLLSHLVENDIVMVSANSLQTASGHRVIADPGFMGDATAPKDRTPASVEIFVMGDVFYDDRPVRLLEGAQDLDTNLLNQIAETEVQLAYNPCTVGSITVTSASLPS